MKIKRNNLTDELMGFQQEISTPKKQVNKPILINYNQIIEKQSQIIQNLYKECIELRQKIHRMQSQEKFIAEIETLPEKNVDKFRQMIENQLLLQIGVALEISTQQISKLKIMQTIKRFKWERQKKSQPIFIQLVKQVRIPVPIQTVVEKKIYVQKQVIKYVDKIIQKPVIKQKIVQVPVFRQKIVQKLIVKAEQQQLRSNQRPLYRQKQKPQQNFKAFTRKMSQGTIITKHQNQNYDFYRPSTKGNQQNGQNRKQNLDNQRNDNQTINKTQIYERKSQKQSYNRSNFNSKNSKGGQNRNNYQDQRDYRYQYDEKPYNRNDRTFFKSPNDNNKTTMYSPKYISYDTKLDDDKYNYDKNKFFDSKKYQTNTGNNKNIKRRPK